MAKPNISTKLCAWDEYKDKTPEDALGSVYKHVKDASDLMCTWYWSSIQKKRWTSLGVRGAAFVFMMLGTALPVFAAMQDAPKDKLVLTQWGVVLLVIAGLTVVADRVFGWSSGWMRYITTVTTMENLTRAFELEWSRYIVGKRGALDASDVDKLFDLGKVLEHELVKLQAEETTKWVAEFNTGISLLESLIRTQREETDKKLDAIRTSLTAQDANAKADEASKHPGTVQVTLVHKAQPRTIQIALDSELAQQFLGLVWVKPDVAPGLHHLTIVVPFSPPVTIQQAVDVKPAAISCVEVHLPG